MVELLVYSLIITLEAEICVYSTEYFWLVSNSFLCVFDFVYDNFLKKLYIYYK